jgi:hypothetical protein
MDQQEHASLLSCQPIYFEGEIKEEKWAYAMKKKLKQLKEKTHGIL